VLATSFIPGLKAHLSLLKEKEKHTIICLEVPRSHPVEGV